jgi:hypothetical protein
MHTAGLAPASPIPPPGAIDQHFPSGGPFPLGGQGQGFRGANGDQIDGMAFPEGTSAWYLSHVLQQLSDPTMHALIDPTMADPKTLSGMIVQHTRIFSSMGWRVGTDYIALMKLHHPSLFGGIGPMSIIGQNNTQAAHDIRVTIEIIHGKAGKLVQSDDLLNKGVVDPSWAFAMCYASQLLIAHGDGTLQDANWFQKVTNLRNALDKISKRWKIAGELPCGKVVGGICRASANIIIQNGTAN